MTLLRAETAEFQLQLRAVFVGIVRGVGEVARRGARVERRRDVPGPTSSSRTAGAWAGGRGGQGGDARGGDAAEAGIAVAVAGTAAGEEGESGGGEGPEEVQEDGVGEEDEEDEGGDGFAAGEEAEVGGAEDGRGGAEGAGGDGAELLVGGARVGVGDGVARGGEVGGEVGEEGGVEQEVGGGGGVVGHAEVGEDGGVGGFGEHVGRLPDVGVDFVGDQGAEIVALVDGPWGDQGVVARLSLVDEEAVVGLEERRVGQVRRARGVARGEGDRAGADGRVVVGGLIRTDRGQQLVGVGPVHGEQALAPVQAGLVLGRARQEVRPEELVHARERDRRRHVVILLRHVEERDARGDVGQGAGDVRADDRAPFREGLLGGGAVQRGEVDLHGGDIAALQDVVVIRQIWQGGQLLVHRGAVIRSPDVGDRVGERRLIGGEAASDEKLRVLAYGLDPAGPSGVPGVIDRGGVGVRGNEGDIVEAQHERVEDGKQDQEDDEASHDHRGEPAIGVGTSDAVAKPRSRHGFRSRVVVQQACFKDE
nr:hypothetical protein CFP56_65507 [Quercus suber]